MRTKKILKKDREAFERDLNAFIDAHCHIKQRRVASDAFEPNRYLKTKYGVDYEVRGIEASDGLFNLMGAFEGGKEEYARIKADGIDCNPFTGKWNFHLIDCTAAEAVEHITRWLGVVLPEPKP